MGNEVTVGLDVGTTSVKALAVDRDGRVVGQVRVPHRIGTPAPDQMEHDARKAWRQSPRRAYAALQAELSVPVAGVTISSMVPSLTAVDRRGIPRLPGLLYGDTRGGADPESVAGQEEGIRVSATGKQYAGSQMPDAERFVSWASSQVPDAYGFWPCQAVASYALAGIPIIDSGVCGTFGPLYGPDGWNAERLAELGAKPEQMPGVVPITQAGGTLPGTDTVISGGTIDALCDQLVAGATAPGDVLVIVGATLITWIVTEEWKEVPGLYTVPHTWPGMVIVGGPSNAGALFVDWARRLLRGVGQPVNAAGAPGPASDSGPDGRGGDPRRVPVWLPYLRGERSPFHDPMLRASVHGLDITQGPGAIERAAYEASGFVVRRMLERSGLEGRRIVASGGGTRVVAWMNALADATGLPVEAVAVPEGAAYGAAYIARVAAGLEPSLLEAQRWMRTGRRFEPDPVWQKEAETRYRRFEELGPGT